MEEMDEILQEKEKTIVDFETERGSLIAAHEKSAAHIRQLDAAAQEEMNGWIQLTDRFSEELQQFRSSCRYCGAMLSAKTINTFCRENQIATDLNRSSFSSDRRGGTGRGGRFESEGAPSGDEFGASGSGLHFFESYEA